ncbi:hypothetical protein [Pseudaquabacterium pictum]|uniref:Uncharacterized protein n=1 Tax=Pseudaquabacterium pictum TaxID=2315236 RepID=A0A480B326_9BURK|nr:hypothetical protein [Rubrivivax pictus]GCL66305.1 hypothetical protein AQPW35_53860 [Rubrivivax pictus]
MHALKTIAPMQQLAAFAMAAVITLGMVMSMGALADTQHADALASAKGAATQLCAAPQRSARG